MISYSHYNFVRLRRQRIKTICRTVAVLAVSVALGVSFFF